MYTHAWPAGSQRRVCAAGTGSCAWLSMRVHHFSRVLGMRGASMTGGVGETRRIATYKREVIASRAVVASNHPLASAAGIEMLTRGGNAVDAAVATLFALSVVEPMMVSPFGAGFFVIRDARSGSVVFIDNYASVPAAAMPDMYEPVPGSLDYETVGEVNSTGYRSVATPGALKGWAHAVERYGRLPLAALVEPAIRSAATGFAASAYLVNL